MNRLYPLVSGSFGRASAIVGIKQGTTDRLLQRNLAASQGSNCDWWKRRRTLLASRLLNFVISQRYEQRRWEARAGDWPVSPLTAAVRMASLRGRTGVRPRFAVPNGDCGKERSTPAA